MSFNKVKKGIKLLLIISGAIVLISEIYATEKNYYLQSFGVICLMLGVFLVNTTVTHKVEHTTNRDFEEEE